jgi:hypothetical protein
MCIFINLVVKYRCIPEMPSALSAQTRPTAGFPGGVPTHLTADCSSLIYRRFIFVFALLTIETLWYIKTKKVYVVKRPPNEAGPRVMARLNML